MKIELPIEYQSQILHQRVQYQNRGKKGEPRAVKNITMSNLEQKHPVSLLGELASKRKWGAPSYTLVHEVGPAHAKSFMFKVR